MRRFLFAFALATALISCDKGTSTNEFKTAYVDTSKLLEEYTEAKDIDAKYKNRAGEMGKELEAETARFRKDAAAFEEKARALGQVWAQQNSASLQKRQGELQYAQQAMLQQLQQESGVEMDSLVKSVKSFIKEYGAKEGYDYIYGTGEAVSILYAKEKYDITDDVVKKLNERYKGSSRVDTVKTPVEKKK